MTFVLVHSPLVGPFTWSLVADELKRRGFDALVPTLRDDNSELPYWQQHAESVARALEAVPPNRPLIYVAHSGAGPLLPIIRERSGHPVAAYVFVDAGIPENGVSPLNLGGASAWANEMRALLASGGSFPNWSDDDLREIIPDDSVRQKLLAELHPRGRAFWEEAIPVFADFPDAPCAYLQFSPPYERAAEYARQHNWSVRKMDAAHFHMLVDPIAVTDAVLDLVNTVGAGVR
jgi:hypothetical protein